MNYDSTTNIEDVVACIAAYTNGSMAADLNNDGMVNGDDVAMFVMEFNQ
jgi:hypothetical protein